MTKLLEHSEKYDEIICPGLRKDEIVIILNSVQNEGLREIDEFDVIASCQLMSHISILLELKPPSG